MIKVVKHGTTTEIIQEIERQGKSIRKRCPIRTRVLIQSVGNNHIVLRGSLFLSAVEIANILKVV